MENLWVSIEDSVVTIGVLESGLEDATEIYHVDLPAENSEIEGEEICGEVHTDDGPVNLYSPVTGTVLEINSAVIAIPKCFLKTLKATVGFLKLMPLTRTILQGLSKNPLTMRWKSNFSEDKL